MARRSFANVGPAPAPRGKILYRDRECGGGTESRTDCGRPRGANGGGGMTTAQVAARRGREEPDAEARRGSAAREELRRRFADRLVVRADYSRRLVSWQGNKARPGLRWFRYKEGFSADLAAGALRAAGGPVLDPFAGVGTAVLVAGGAGAKRPRRRDHARRCPRRPGGVVDRERHARRSHRRGRRPAAARGLARRRAAHGPGVSLPPTSPSPSAPSPPRPRRPSPGPGPSWPGSRTSACARSSTSPA